MKSRVLFFFLFCTIRATLLAQTTYYSNNTSTNFNTLSGWSLNTNGTGANPSVLNNSVRLVVQSGHTKSTSATATVNRLTIRSGGTVTANHAITISGSSDRFEIENGGTYIHNNTGTISSTIFGGTEAFGESSTFQINNWQSSSTSITSSLSLSATSSVDGNDYYYGNLIINWAGSGNWNQNWPSYPSATLLTAGDFTVQSVGEFRFAEANGRVPDIYVAGNFIMNSTGSGNDIVDLAEGNNATGYINVYGNITHSNGTITASGSNSTGSIWTYRPGTSYWTFSGGSRNRLTYVLQNSKQVLLNSNFDLGTNLNGEKMYIEAGSVLDAQQYVMSNASSNAYITNYGAVRTAHPSGLWTSGQSVRTVSNSNNFQIHLETGSTVEYYGTNGQIVSSLNGLAGSYDQYQNLTISSANTKVAEGNITVESVFNFTGTGNYLQVGSNIVTIDDAGSISNAGPNAYFILQPTSNTNGRLRQNNLSATARVFPIGNSSNYLPATITPTSAGTDFSVAVFRGTTTNGSPTGSAFGSRTYQVDAVWIVDRTAGPANATIRFDWITGSIEGAAFAATPNNQIGIWRYETGNWLLTPNTPGPNYVANNTTNLAYTSGVVTNFGTAGSGFSYIVANINVLPGKLLSFTTDAKPGENMLKWKVADPTQFQRYEVEVSTNGFAFSHLTELRSSTQSEEYFLSDKANTQQTVYYRLKLWDHFGQATYSNIVVVKRELAAGLIIVQNPVSDHLIFRHPSAKNAYYQVVDFTGRVFMKGAIPAGNMQTSVAVSTLPAGSYVLQYSDGTSQFAQKFLK
ncbi:putative secreted protein (Por secretion system target) [Lacibacter cauensis]|uniref:Putative secreted protein (Por secretion system target) n=1 Tax=Lacibacter cauensis TaxID=510947 RepID=A0A562SCZ4_9BACT|nr:T9SS type A sorting domain-containing protein [Lacibacter cauensis]TWI79215.1 putative secreted protein (Por secretion system target) [Lacibacter cauensis]